MLFFEGMDIFTDGPEMNQSVCRGRWTSISDCRQQQSWQHLASIFNVLFQIAWRVFRLFCKNLGIIAIFLRWMCAWVYMYVYKHMHTPAPPHTTVARQWIITQTSYTRHWNIAELAISSTNVVGKDFGRTAPLFCYAILLHFFSPEPPGWLDPFLHWIRWKSSTIINDYPIWRESEKYLSVGRRMTNRCSYGFWNNLSIKNQRVLRSSISRGRALTVDSNRNPSVYA